MELGHINNLSEWEPYHTDDTSTLFVGDAHRTLVRLAIDDINAGKPVVFFGDCTELLEQVVPYEEVQLIKPSLQPFALNILNDPHPQLPSVLIDALKGIWGYDLTATPVLDMYLRAGILTAMERGETFLHIKKFLTKPEKVKDKFLKDFWHDYEALTVKDKRQETASTLNKLWAFLLDADIRHCLGQKDNRINSNGIVFVDLDENTRILGAFILTYLYLYSNATIYIEQAHQYGSFIKKMVDKDVRLAVDRLSQFPRDTVPTILSVDRVVAFRCGLDDYERMSPLFGLKELETKPYEIQYRYAMEARYGKTTLIDMAYHPHSYVGKQNKIIKRCKSQYTLPKQQIEKRMREL